MKFPFPDLWHNHVLYIHSTNRTGASNAISMFLTFEEAIQQFCENFGITTRAFLNNTEVTCITEELAENLLEEFPDTFLME